MNEVVAISVAEAASRLGVTKPTLYRALSSGALRSLHVGRRRLILVTDFEDWLHALADEEAGRLVGA